MDPIIEEKPNGDFNVIYFLYHPSKAAGMAFLLLFAITTLAHFCLMFPFRAAFFIPLVMGGIMETFGYYGRFWASDDPKNVSPWVLQAMLLISAPPLICATIYMSLSRMITTLHARENALMSPRGMTPLFVTADVIAFISQIAGVGMQAVADKTAQTIGKNVVLGGLIFQLLLLAFFVYNVYTFHIRNSRNPTALTDHPQIPRWRRLIYVLYSIGTVVFVRNLVRAIEYAQGPRGMVAREEVFVYLFDGVLILGSMVALLISHPGRMIKNAKRVDTAIGNAAAETVKESLGARGPETRQV